MLFLDKLKYKVYDNKFFLKEFLKYLRLEEEILY